MTGRYSAAAPPLAGRRGHPQIGVRTDRGGVLRWRCSSRSAAGAAVVAARGWVRGRAGRGAARVPGRTRATGLTGPARVAGRDRTCPTRTCGCPSRTTTVGYNGSPDVPRRARAARSDGRVVTANGGEVERGRRGDGQRRARWRSPPKCDGADRLSAGHGGGRCPTRRSTPGTATSSTAPRVWLAPDQTTTGSNIVQKGRFGTDGGQWKLQVDSDEGEPSCVVRVGRGEPVMVRSSVSIADSAWHRVVCRRDADGVSIEVDGDVDREGRRDRLGDQRVADPRRQPRAWATTTTSSTAGSTTSSCGSSPRPDAEAQAGRATQSEASSSAKAARSRPGAPTCRRASPRRS